MSPGKVKRFLAQAIPEDFASRQLNDTGFASRQAIGFLKRLWPDVGVDAPVHVQAVTGRVTTQLRRLWELNNILADDGKKTRADQPASRNRCTRCSLRPSWPDTEAIGLLAGEGQCRGNEATSRCALVGIRADATHAIEEIVVSHRVRKKVSGPLHAEMPLGYTGQDHY